MSLLFLALVSLLLLAAYLLSRPSRPLKVLGALTAALVLGGAALFLLANLYSSGEVEVFEAQPESGRRPLTTLELE
ncbi:MAG TPA: hypothetical protein VFE20_06465 [Thermoleophilia bacterium]|nr:hypothetical protein [Thermoleophilia bacterium]